MTEVELSMPVALSAAAAARVNKVLSQEAPGSSGIPIAKSSQPSTTQFSAKAQLTLLPMIAFRVCEPIFCGRLGNRLV